MIIPFVKLVALVPPGTAILPESREKFEMARKITPLIAHKLLQIKWLVPE
jgi:hypothetical protein